MIEEKLIVLFDEFGTPVFKNKSAKDIFVGVSTLYELSEEDKIFNALNKDMGLSNSKPLKNDRIGSKRADKIAQEVGKQNIHITTKSIDLNNKTLRNKIETYVEFGNFSRTLWRKVGPRKEAHYIHSQILVSCLFDIICWYLDGKTNGKYNFEINIDNWSYPKTDSHIILEYSPERLQEHIQIFVNDYLKNDIQVYVEPIVFLSSYSDKRKRFIDAVTSIVSRSFLDLNNPKYDLQPVEKLRNGLGNRFNLSDITMETIKNIDDFMYQDIQKTKTKEKPIVIL